MSTYHSQHDTESEIVETHLECTDCGSSDALTEYTDHSYCFSCSEHTWTNPHTGRDKDTMPNVDPEVTIGIYGTLKDRGISKDVCKKFGVTIKAVARDKGEDNIKYDIIKHYYPYHDEAGNHVANKVRICADKSKMPWEGKPKRATLFGQLNVKKGTILTITEGELDAMAAYQMFGERHNFVSVANGAKGALKDCKANLKWLDKFTEVYICFDNDEAGHAAAKDVAMLFDGRAKIVQLDNGFKDACDYLKAGKAEQFVETWWASEFYVPSEIITGDAIIDLIDNYKEKECFDLPWQGLTKMTYGYRLGETWAFVSHAKVGKTSAIREIVHHILHAKDGRDHKVGTIFLEGPVREHALGFLSLEADIPFHLPDSVYTDKDFEDAKKSLPVKRLCLYKREGVIDINGIINVIRYYIRAMDCKVIVLDNLMSLVSDQPSDEERKLLNTVINKVVKLGEDTETWIILVAHLNRQTGLIHGTSLLEKLAYTVVEFNRDLEADTYKERNTTEVIVKFNRFSGDTGPACDLFYEKSTGRMREQDIADREPVKKKYKPKQERKKKGGKTDEFETVKETTETTSTPRYVEPDID